jgi:F0F1-type ATP synthase membrane subunit c/vacuolar-type H+-ATPase subunit K
MRLAMLVSIALYVVLVEMLPAKMPANPVIYRVLTVLAAALVAGIFLVRKTFVYRAQTSLQDPKLLARWRTGYLITYLQAEAIALYGLVLHFLGFSLLQISPFLIGCFLLVLFLGPRSIETT